MPAYTQDDKNNIVWAVFVAMEGGKSLRHACRDEGISEATVLRWIDADETGEWSKQYTRARDGLLSHHANEILTIADSCYDAAKARVQIDSRKWILSRLLPKRFGDKVSVGGSDDLPPIQNVTRIELIAAKINDDDTA